MRRKWFDIRWREKLAGGELSLGREMEVKFWWHDSRGKGFDPFFSHTHTWTILGSYTSTIYFLKCKTYYDLSNSFTLIIHP